MQRRLQIPAAIVLVAVLVLLTLRAATGAPENAKLDYANDIRPIFQANCAKCHLNGVRKGGMDLGSRDNLLKGGESEEPAVVPHDSASSRMIMLLTSDDPEMRMPQKAPPLPAEQLAKIRTWIDRGAPWGDAPGAEPKYVARLEPRHVTLPEGTDANPIDRLLAPYFASHVAAESHVPMGGDPASPSREEATQASQLQMVGDRLFARRVYLDTIGLLPTADQVESFVKDSRPDKRDKLVATLLADNERYAEHWMSFWNDALRNDYAGTGYIDGGRKQITAWLYKALFDNMPYDKFVASLINPTPECEGFINGIIWRGAVSASQGKEVQAAQNVTQIFLGLNFKCNSCHDSFISDWKLADSYGLAGAFADKPMEMYRCEKPTGHIAKVKFLYPQLGDIDGDAPRATKVRQLADLMTSKQNGRLARTMVNRLWARFMGRGIVEPVDEMDQKPWNEDLLDWLACDFADHGYDVKHTIALILTSRAYQMPSVGMHEQIEKDFVFKGPVVRRMSAEQFVDAISQLTGQWHEQPTSGEALSLPQFALPAKWIWTSATAREKAPPETIELKKEFDLPEKPTEAIVAADADNSYQLLINGKPAAKGKDFSKPNIVNIAKFLRAGKNVFEVKATNDPMPDVKEGQSPDNPAGFWLLASIRLPVAATPASPPEPEATQASQLREISSDKTWLARKAESEDEFKPAIELGDTNVAPWTLGPKLGSTKKQYTYRFDHTRAVWVKNDVLMTALGRPNREQVVTHRFSPATMLQMLEMTNGRKLYDMVENGAKRWRDRKFESSDKMIDQLFREALGRPPSEQELAQSLELVGSPAHQDGVEDLLWSILMLPEFQLVY